MFGYLINIGDRPTHRTCITILGNMLNMKTKPTKLIVAANVQRLMAEAGDERGKQIGLAARAGVAQSSIGRLIRGEVDARLDVLDAVAKAFGVTAADLAAEHDESFINYDRKRFASLPASEKAKVETFISFLIASTEQSKGDALEVRQITQPTPAEKSAASAASQTRLNQQTLDTNDIQDQRKPRGTRQRN